MPSSFGIRFGYIASVIGAVLTGFSPILVRLSEAGPVATGFYRVFFVIPFFLLLMMAERSPRQSATPAPKNARDYLLFVALGAVFSVNLTTWNISLFYTSVAYSTLFANLAAIFIIPIGWLLFGLKVRKLFIVCAIGGFAGVALLFGVQENASAHLFGNLLAIVAAFCYACYQLLINRLRLKFTAAEVMMWTGMFTSLFLIPSVFFLGEDLRIPTLFTLMVLLTLSLLCQGVGQGLISYSLGHLPPSLVSLTLLIQPIVAAVMGWWLFAESLGTLQILGMCVTLIFLYFAKRFSIQ